VEDKQAEKEMPNGAERAYKEVCEEFGQEKAIQYLLFLKALHEETAICFRSKPAPPDC